MAEYFSKCRRYAGELRDTNAWRGFEERDVIDMPVEANNIYKMRSIGMTRGAIVTARVMASRVLILRPHLGAQYQISYHAYEAHHAA